MSVFQEVAQVFMDAQLEIAIFIIAICAQFFLFSNYSFKLHSLKSEGCQIPQQSSPKENQELTSDHVLPLSKVAPCVELIKQLGAAIQSSNLEAALICIKSCASQWRANFAQTPSIASQHLMQELVQLACKEVKLLVVIRELHDCGLFTPWVLECALGECMPKHDTLVMKETEEFACAHGVNFTDTAYCMLIRGASTEHEVLDIYNKHCTGVDICADTCAGRRVVEAALHCDRAEIITRLLMLAKDVPKQVALLKSFSVEGRRDEVNAIFQACPKKDARIYNEFLCTCIESQDVQAAEHIMSEAAAAGVADVVTYNTLIKIYLLAQDPKRARKVLEVMKAVGFAASDTAFNELINATIKSSTHDAWAIVDEMETHGLKPSQVTCSILLKSIQKNSPRIDVERCLALLDSMDEEMDEVLLSSACEACIRTGHANFLRRQLAQERFNKRVQVKGAHTYGSLIRAYGFVKDISGAWTMWSEMRAHQIIPTSITIGCMVEALVLNGETNSGYELIRELLDNEQTASLVNAVIYCSILKGFSHEKRFDCVWAVYQEMLDKKIKFTIVTYNSLIDACARNNEMIRVTQILEEMCNQKIMPNTITYSIVLKGYCMAGSIEKALQLLEDMKATMVFRPDEIAYNTLLDGCACWGFYDRGIALLKDMEEQGVQPSNFTLSVVAKLALRNKRPDKAFELCEQISSKYHIRMNIHVYNNLLQACNGTGDTQHALKIFEQMLHEKMRPDARSYTLLIRGCLRKKQARDAAGFLRAAMGIRGAHPRIVGFGMHAFQMHGALDPEIITEILECISNDCSNEELAVQLIKELRTLSHVKLDSALSLRLTSKAVRTTNKW